MEEFKDPGCLLLIAEYLKTALALFCLVFQIAAAQFEMNAFVVSNASCLSSRIHTVRTVLRFSCFEKELKKIYMYYLNIECL